MAKVAWPISYGYGGEIRVEQIDHMTGVLPDRYFSEEAFLGRIKFSLRLCFPEQTDEFYDKAMNEIKEIGDRKYILDKD